MEWYRGANRDSFVVRPSVRNSRMRGCTILVDNSAGLYCTGGARGWAVLYWWKTRLYCTGGALGWAVLYWWSTRLGCTVLVVRLLEYILDYGPVFSFRLYSFERFNTRLG